MKIWFCRSKTVVGRLIQLATFSKWNHVALQVGGIVYEVDMKGGVRMVRLKDFLAMWSETQCLDVYVRDQAATIRWLNQQLGKPYDFMAILALPFRTTWQHPHKWFCSELVAKALAVGGLREFAIEKFRITPRDLWILAPWYSDKDRERLKPRYGV